MLLIVTTIVAVTVSCPLHRAPLRRLLHLESCQNTIIGNDLLRGVSGGEKKRVTVGEGLMTNAPFLCLDEISTGEWASCVVVSFAASLVCTAQL